MIDNVISWNFASMIVVSVLSIYAGIKFIDRIFDKQKKKNTLF